MSWHLHGHIEIFSGKISLISLALDQIILMFESGPYTSMRTWKRSSILKFDHHLKRLMNSAQGILNAKSNPDQPVPTRLQELVNLSSLRQIVLKNLEPAMNVALEHKPEHDHRVVVFISLHLDRDTPVDYDMFVHISSLLKRPIGMVKVCMACVCVCDVCVDAVC